ncbi:TLR21 protein, partial [Atractosteus spatula]|nr:TLR21 protein [Atractosteus spatula]
MTVDGGLVVNCSAQNYPNTSCLIPPTTATLDLSHNNIEKIEEQDFTGVKGLKKLYLQFNQISFIDHRAFEDNPELEYLDISNNYLLEGSVLPFKNLVALNYLDISNNIGDKIQLGPQDSTWVMNNLLKQLESDDPPYRICIHERDFTPGKAIIANIIDCISKSYKTVFVLSKNFVQSEWCHYEFFLAQHRVFEERRDSLILLLLEPIPANSIPDRFCKLRKMMNKSTYLEWPPDEARQSMFWKRLKAVLNLEVKAPSLQGNPGK